MIDEQLAIYSSLVFQWIVLAGILVVAGLFIKSQFEAIAAKLNLRAQAIEKQITDTAKTVSKVETDLTAVETEMENIKNNLTEGNVNLSDVSVKIHSVVEQLNETLSSLQKTKNDFLAKFKFSRKE